MTVILGLVGLNGARREWALALRGLLLATGLLHLLAVLSLIEDR